MGSIDIPPFLREKMKEQQAQSQPVQTGGGDIPPFLKKKDDGITASQGGITPVSPSTLSASVSGEIGEPFTPATDLSFAQSRLSKSFLDRDIDSKHDISLRNPTLYKPTEKFSLRNLYNDNRQKQFDTEIEITRNEVKSSPDKLAEYNRQRIQEINDHIAEMQFKQNLLLGGTYGGVTAPIKDPKQYAELDGRIQEANIYKDKLKGAVMQEAVTNIVPKYLDPSIFNPRQIGRELIKIADPELEAQYQAAEKGGGDDTGHSEFAIGKNGIGGYSEFFKSVAL